MTGNESVRDNALRTAASLLRSVGFKGMSMAAIAEGVGVSPPALYWHFANKEELVYELLAELVSQFNSRVDLILQTKSDPPDQIRDIVIVHTLIQLESPDDARLYSSGGLFGQFDDYLTPEHANALRGPLQWYHQVVRDVIRQGLADGQFVNVKSPTIAAFAIQSACEFSYLWYDRDGPQSVEEVAATNADLMLKMLGYVEPKAPGSAQQKQSNRRR